MSLYTHSVNGHPVFRYYAEEADLAVIGPRRAIRMRISELMPPKTAK